MSLNSGSRVLAALQRQGVDAHAFDPAEKPLDALRGFDRVHRAARASRRGWHDSGRAGADGHSLHGSGVMASALGMDKWRTKLLWQAAGLRVPEYALLAADSDFAGVEAALGLPLFVKPACEGSSIGISMVTRHGDLAAAYAEAAKHDPLVIAERGILGGEYTVGIVGEGGAMRALPIIKIEPATAFYDYEAKYRRDDTRYLCPCGLDAAREATIREQALDAFRVLGGRGWGASIS